MTTTAQSAREALIQLERTRQEKARAREEAAARVKQLARADVEERKAERAVEAAELEVERAERREEGIRQGADVASRRTHFERRFRELADGRVWNEGIYPHQWQGVCFGAVADRWILADGPGLGKTRQTIGWADLVGTKKMVAVVPASVCEQWAGEAMTLAPHRTVTNLAGLSKQRRTEALDAAIQHAEGIIVVNYEIWRLDKDVLAKLMSWQPDTVVADEAHVMKNVRSANFRNVYMLAMVDNLCPQCGGLLKGLYEPGPKGTRKVARPCASCGWKIGSVSDERRYSNPLEEALRTKSVKHMMLTTGTPILNSPEDLFPLLHFCDPTLFPNAKDFLAVYCTHNYHSGKWEFRGGALKHLKPLIAGRFLQRTKEDVGIELPARRVHVVAVELDEATHPLQYRTIRQLSKAAMILLESGQKHIVTHLMTLIMRKRQANVWPGGIEIKDVEGNVIFRVGDEVRESAKLDKALEILKWAQAEGRRTVVFSQFKTALAELEERVNAAGIRVARLDGDTKKTMRSAIKSNFYRALNEVPKWDALLANYASGGVGLNLTACTVTIILDEEWSPGKRDQAYDRTHRIGQEEESDVFVLRMPRTIDVWMANAIHRKEQLVEGFTGTMKGADDMTAAALLEAMKGGDVL